MRYVIIAISFAVKERAPDTTVSPAPKTLSPPLTEFSSVL
jgi:hypothetical protein